MEKNMKMRLKKRLLKKLPSPKFQGVKLKSKKKLLITLLRLTTRELN